MENPQTFNSVLCPTLSLFYHPGYLQSFYLLLTFTDVSKVSWKLLKMTQSPNLEDPDTLKGLSKGSPTETKTLRPRWWLHGNLEVQNIDAVSILGRPRNSYKTAKWEVSPSKALYLKRSCQRRPPCLHSTRNGRPIFLDLLELYKPEDWLVSNLLEDKKELFLHGKLQLFLSIQY